MSAENPYGPFIPNKWYYATDHELPLLYLGTREQEIDGTWVKSHSFRLPYGEKACTPRNPVIWNYHAIDDAMWVFGDKPEPVEGPDEIGTLEFIARATMGSAIAASENQSEDYKSRCFGGGAIGRAFAELVDTIREEAAKRPGLGDARPTPPITLANPATPLTVVDADEFKGAKLYATHTENGLSVFLHAHIHDLVIEDGPDGLAFATVVIGGFRVRIPVRDLPAAGERKHYGIPE